MAQVEDVRRGGLSAFEDVRDGRLKHGRWGGQESRVEVSLHNNAPTKTTFGFIERDAVIDADGIHTNFKHEGQEFAGTDTKVNGGHRTFFGRLSVGTGRDDIAEVTHMGECLARCRHDVRRIIAC